MGKAEQAEERAFELHRGGFHCAEAVLKALAETYGGVDKDFSPRLATALGGGMGRSKQETCGVLVGGILALGLLYGRDEPGRNWDWPADLAAEFRQRFAQEYGSTNCAVLLEAFGPQEDMIRCKMLSGEAARMLGNILAESGAV